MKTRLQILSFLLVITLIVNNGFADSKSQPEYTLEQAMSDNAQLSTIAFSGLAFITGSSGADTFMPPGKVADFFGFQYMRDVDTAGYGHNTQFLSRVANNMLYILTDEQKAKLVALAKEQSSLYTNFSYNRFPIMNAFRRSLEGNIPNGSTGLDINVVGNYTKGLYKTDADLSYNRALIAGQIIQSFTDEQKSYLEKMEFDNFLSWPDISEDESLKKNLTNTEFVAVMTYASEMFSWYKGSITADVYFCPERHGTYFGGFYMKDYPAMNNPTYFISTSVTGDSGQEFLKILDSTQRELITSIIVEQKDMLAEIGQIRNDVSIELRKAISGDDINKDKVYSLIARYGQLDGEMSALYADRFSKVNKTLTDDQRNSLIKLRNLDVVPEGAYRFSTPVDMPEIPNTDFMFGVGDIPETAGQLTAPESFSDLSKSENKLSNDDLDKNQEIDNTNNSSNNDSINTNDKDKNDKDKNSVNNSDKENKKPDKNTNKDKNKPSKPKKQEDSKDSKKPSKNTELKKRVKVIFKGEEIETDSIPIVKNGRTLVPIRAIAEKLGAKVAWDPTSKTVNITRNEGEVKLTIGDTKALVNGSEVLLETPAEIENKRTLVPIRFIAESFGLNVNWNNDDMTATIADK